MLGNLPLTELVRLVRILLNEGQDLVDAGLASNAGRHPKHGASLGQHVSWHAIRRITLSAGCWASCRGGGGGGRSRAAGGRLLFLQFVLSGAAFVC